MANWRDGRRRYTQYEGHEEQLPSSHLEAIDAVERHAPRFGPATDETVVTRNEGGLTR